MNALAPISTDRKALALIRRTVAADATDLEFDVFIRMVQALQLDPLRRQIYCLVYNKDKPEKRRVVYVTGIDGFRSVAARTGNYRPDENEPTFEFDESLKDPKTNPLGLVKATVRVYRFAHRGWYPITAAAYWDEFAPLKEAWVFDEQQHKRVPGGKFELDTSGQWGRMPRLMLAKCAEAQALRKGWPDNFSGLYEHAEMDRAQVIDVTPSEAVAEAAVEERQAKLGGPQILVAWHDNDPLVGVPVGQFADRVLAYIEANKDEPAAVLAWAERNRVGMREFWAHAPGDALEVKREIERLQAAAMNEPSDEVAE